MQCQLEMEILLFNIYEMRSISLSSHFFLVQVLFSRYCFPGIIYSVGGGVFH